MTENNPVTKRVEERIAKLNVGDTIDAFLNQSDSEVSGILISKQGRRGVIETQWGQFECDLATATLTPK